MTGRAFVDTNLLVYARDSSERDKQPKALEWITHLWRSRSGTLSIQVLLEFYVTVTRKLKPGMDRRMAREDVRSFVSWRPMPITPAVVEAAWLLEDRFELAWWDALIVSAAQSCGCRYLLTEDLQDGCGFGEVEVVNPFRRTHRELA
jgi:predicted nucleic acid-binding protein